MSRESDKELLMAFANYMATARYVAFHEMIPGAAEQAIENFLASREPQANSCARCGHSRSLHDDSAPIRVGHEFAAREPQATAQRYWKLHTAYGSEGFIAWVCDANGKNLERLTPITGVRQRGRDFTAEAESDGRASGLPEWKPDAAELAARLRGPECGPSSRSVAGHTGGDVR